MKPIPYLCFKAPLGSEMLVLLASASVLAMPVSAQDVPRDWSNGRIIYVNPESLEDALAKGNLHKWAKNANDPRFVLQLEAKELKKQSKASRSEKSLNATATKGKKRPPALSPDVDWSSTLVGGRVATGVFPAKFPFSAVGPVAVENCGTTTTAGDFVVFPVNVAGKATQPTIIAFNNLYTGTLPGPEGLCGSKTTPSVLWAYNTTNAILNSPVLSLDGKAVAWVNSDGDGSDLTLRVLRWQLGDGTTGSFPDRTIGTVAAPPACSTPAVAPCMFTVPLAASGEKFFALSSLFVDYGSDTGYITDGKGHFYKVQDVFSGTVAPSLAWGNGVAGDASTRVETAAKKALTSPVYDFNGHILAVDTAGNLYQVNDVAAPSTPAVPTPLNVAADGSVSDGVMLSIDSLDSADTRVFVHADTGINYGGTFGDQSKRGVVVQASIDPLAIEAVAPTGLAGGINVYMGAFDHTYKSSPDTGFLYVASTGVSNANRTALYAIGFADAGYPTMNSAIPLANVFQLVNGGAQVVSPVTEIYNSNTNTDWLFVSVGNRCAPGGVVPAFGNTGCITSFDITGGFPTAVSNVVFADGGTSGIVIDNVSSEPQASSIYFGEIGGKTAVKLTQLLQ